MKITLTNPVLEKGKTGHKLENPGGKGRISKSQIRSSVNTVIGSKDATLNVIATNTGVTTVTGRMNTSMKKTNGNNENLITSGDQQTIKGPSIGTSDPSNPTFGNVRNANTCVGMVSHESVVKTKDFPVKNFPSDIDTKLKNYQMQSDCKESVGNQQDYKSRSCTSVTGGNLPSRLATQSAVNALQRDNPMTSSGQHSRPASRNDNSVFVVARKALEQQKPATKMAPINFPPLRAPQSIVNVRHPFVTEARTKHNEVVGGCAKTKLNAVGTLQNISKDRDHGRQTFHNYGTSQIPGIPSVQNLNNVTANLSPYPRPDSFPQPPVASVLFPETAQFPQSPSFSTAQIGHLNQYQPYDPGSFATTPVNVNPVIPQFSAENSIPYPQFADNPPQFVQTNHYPGADMANSQYQYQSVSQIQDSPLFIPSLQSPIAVTDQYAAPNYATAVRTELIPRLRRPPRFNK